MEMSDQETPITVDIDTEGMENRIVEKFNIKFQALEEMMTKQEQTKALNETSRT